MADSNKREKIAAAKKKLKQFQKSGRARSVSRNREASQEKENVPRGREPAEKSVRTTSPPTSDSGDTVIEAQIDLPPAGGPQGKTTASTESLQQLSRQINGLLSEERNRDLASMLEKHSQANQQLNSQNQQLREHSKALQEQLEGERNSFHEKHRKDIGSLKEQLQVHIQTIGILVAEKTELQSQVTQSQRLADQRMEEIEELSGRLKASRQRVADMERTLSTSSQSSQQLEKAAAEHSKEIDRLKLELYKTTKQKEEFQQQASELTHNIQAKVEENSANAKTMEDLQKRLEMAELYAQQLSIENENSAGSVEVLCSLQKERDSLLGRLHQHEQLAKKLQLEKDQVTQQYQQYTDQLARQSQELAQQVSALTEEREHLLNNQQELESTVTGLQNKLVDESNKPTVPVVPTHVQEEIEKLKATEAEMKKTLEAQVRDNMQLSRLLEESEDKIVCLEKSVEEMGEQAGDKAQLLENIQNDRTALSRALSQNKELKLQLEELQQGFVKMSNDNMELVTKLQAEEHSVKDMSTTMEEKENEISRLQQIVTENEAKMGELEALQENVEKEMYHQDQMTDRLRHYEAQAQLVDALQNELTSAQDMMEALTTQNRELRTMLIKATEVKPPKEDSDGASDDGSQRDTIMESLQATIKQLESERGQLYDNLKEQRELSDRLGINIADLQEEVIRKSSESMDSEKISRSEYIELRTAMEMIQQKYMHVMKDKADLSDKADQLEHLVLQLQGETDTIGEYISLYHHQRALLQQRETQKNDYIAQLARDREQLQDKLGELQALVMQLLGEKNMLHSYSEESKQQLSPQKNQDEQKQHPYHALSNGMTNSYENEWPDYTSSESDTDSEVEPIVGGQQAPTTSDPELTPTSSPPGTPREINPAHRPMFVNGHDSSPDFQDQQHHNHHHHHHHQQQHPPHPHRQHSQESNSSAFQVSPKEDKTAHKILSLLTELGHSHLVDQVPLIDRNFLPCKFCKGAVQIV